MPAVPLLEETEERLTERIALYQVLYQFLITYHVPKTCHWENWLYYIAPRCEQVYEFVCAWCSVMG